MTTVPTTANSNQLSVETVNEKSTSFATTSLEIVTAANSTVQALLKAGTVGEAIPNNQINASNHVQRTSDSLTLNMLMSVMMATQGTGMDAQVHVLLRKDTLVEK